MEQLDAQAKLNIVAQLAWLTLVTLADKISDPASRVLARRMAAQLHKKLDELYQVNTD